MAFYLMLAGLGLSLGGALMIALGDSWLSRSLLVYLDAIEANVSTLAKAHRTGSTELVSTGINSNRDRGQDRARTLKTFGWLILALGFGLQIGSVCYNSSMPHRDDTKLTVEPESRERPKS